MSFHFRLKDRPGLISFSYADPLAFLFSVDISIGSGCFFPDLDPSVNLIGHAAITEMIKLQFTTITDRIQNKIRNGNWFPKFSINRKEQKFLPICLRLLTLITIIKDPSLRDLRGNQDRQILFLTAPSSKNVCRSLGLTQRRHLPDPLKFCPLGPTGPTVSCISGVVVYIYSVQM